jgi:hypothetical protein
MDHDDALALAQQTVDRNERRAGVPLGIANEATKRIEQGWVFYWNTKSFLASKDPYDMLIGQGPLIVLDDGRVLEGGSAEQPDDVLYRFGLIGRPEFDASVQWADWKGARHSGGGAEYRAKARLEHSATDNGSYPVLMTRTPEPSVWRIRFEIAPGPHEHLRTGAVIIVMEGAREAARATLGRKHRLSSKG